MGDPDGQIRGWKEIAALISTSRAHREALGVHARAAGQAP